ncbi:MAG: hypothetical protein ACYSU0_04400 [Planctomycetota bacterium]
MRRHRGPHSPLCRPGKVRGAPLFKDARDLDYAAMLSAIKEGRQKMLANPPVDMARATATASRASH